VKDVPSAPFNASVPTQALSKSQLSRAPPPSSLLVPANVPKWGQAQQLVVRVQRPRDARAVRRIHAVIECVTDYGTDFEALLMEREKYNEDYAFLFDSNVSPRLTLLTIVTGVAVLSLEIIFLEEWRYPIFMALGTISDV
jgi:hypothetical protein